MKTNKSEVILVLDRSGSMSAIKNDMEGGIKSFLEKQKGEQGECFVSVYNFDTDFEAVFENKNIQEITDVKIEPRGGTSLYDAVAKASNIVGIRLANTDEKERPETVIVVVVTDGEENASKEFSQAKMKEIIERQTNKYNWKYIFLGANQDAVLNGKNMGFAASSSLSYGTSSNAINSTFSVLCSGVSCLRSTGGTYSFSEDQRKAAFAGTP